MKRILALTVLASCLFTIYADSAEARFGRRRCRSCQTSACNTCQASTYHTNGADMAQQGQYSQDPNFGQPGYEERQAPGQPNTTFYRGNPNQPRTAPRQADVNIEADGTLQTPNNAPRANSKIQVETNND